MRLSLRQRTAEEEREAAWLRAVEGGDTSVKDLQRITGLSRSQVYERLKRARENRVEDGPDEADLPHLAITDDPARERGDWYEPESGLCSVESGRVRIGNHNGTRLLVRSLSGGQVTTDETGPTSYEPDPSLKGGVG